MTKARRLGMTKTEGAKQKQTRLVFRVRFPGGSLEGKSKLLTVDQPNRCRHEPRASPAFGSWALGERSRESGDKSPR